MVRRHGVVGEVVTYDAGELRSLLRDGQMPASREFNSTSWSFARSRLAIVRRQNELSQPRLPADVREAEEVEGFRFSLTRTSTVAGGGPPESKQARLIRMQLQRELRMMGFLPR